MKEQKKSLKNLENQRTEGTENIKGGQKRNWPDEHQMVHEGTSKITREMIKGRSASVSATGPEPQIVKPTHDGPTEDIMKSTRK